MPTLVLRGQYDGIAAFDQALILRACLPQQIW
jgi:hypothetical protein